jgi:hypothetical protein
MRGVAGGDLASIQGALKVHKCENFQGSGLEFFTFS